MPDGKTYAISYKENGKTFVLVSDGINSANIEQTNKNINSTPEKVLITPEYSTRAISFKNRILTLIDSRSKGNKWTKNKLLEIVIKNLDSRIQKELNKANKTLLIQIKELLNKEFTQN